MPEIRKHPHWIMGYQAAMADQPNTPPDNVDKGEWTAGYVVGSRDKRDNQLMEEFKKINGGD